MSRSLSFSDRIRPIMGVVKTVPIPSHLGKESGPPPLPFVTISRQYGAGGTSLAHELVDALNHDAPDAEHPWTCWDRELVEKVATDHKLSARLVESLEEQNHSWFNDFLCGIQFSDSAGPTDEAAVYARVAGTVRALAQAGKVVIVGRGGVLLTRRMPGGVHVRLVAPLEHRIEAMARQWDVSTQVATPRVHQLEKNRQAFFHKFWPGETLNPELFTIMLNTAQLDVSALVDAVRALIGRRAQMVSS